MKLKDISHPKTLKIIFDALIMGYIRYHITIIPNAKNSNISKIMPKVNSCLKRMNGLLRSTPNNIMSAISTQPPLHLLFENEILKYILRIKLKNISTFRTMTENLKSEIELVNKSNNAVIMMNEEKYQLRIESIRDNSTIKKLDYHDYTAVERVFMRHMKEIEKWPQWKKNYIKNSVEVMDKIEKLDSKKTLPPPVVKSIAMSVIEESPNEKVYTDGSIASNGNKGIGIYRTGHEISLKVIQPRSSTSVELNAVKASAEDLYKNRIFNSRIYTDSQTSAKLLKSGNHCDENETLIQDTLFWLNKTSTSVQWIPSHVNIAGNEKADELAKSGCESSLCYKNEKVTANDVKIHIRERLREQWKRWFDEEMLLGKGLRSKELFSSPNEKFWFDKFNEKLNGEEIKVMNRIMSGHDLTLASRSFIAREITCRVCNKVDDASHRILKCKKFSNRDFTYNNQPSIIQWIQAVNAKEIKKMINFVYRNKIDI